ncbi:hypothetical protein LRR81_13030 [Metabacillus sp. GX 13764]|uniref:hypothetical protein n=1 Tax=Metabacillus kandeliae TaxID=2900151 RepID=UPI001E333A18|nr:hypothetical protein [Metabacillus kandeliae]MCD7035164.1 hypothetical protein [Metabacillus kandeliae]
MAIWEKALRIGLAAAGLLLVAAAIVLDRHVYITAALALLGASMVFSGLRDNRRKKKQSKMIAILGIFLLAGAAADLFI